MFRTTREAWLCSSFRGSLAETCPEREGATGEWGTFRARHHLPGYLSSHGKVAGVARRSLLKGSGPRSSPEPGLLHAETVRLILIYRLARHGDGAKG